MSASKHTPAPWVVTSDFGGLAVMTKGGSLVVTIRPDRQHGEANASLVAVAPDMLAVVERLVREDAAGDGFSMGLVEDALAVLKRLEGDE